MKKIVCSFTLITLLTISFLGSYAFDVPVYADSVPEGYSPAGVADQVDAFKAYCKSRNLTIEGSMLDAVTTFTTSTYNKICSVLGIDVTELQNQIYKGVGANAGKWYFTNSGIGAMNRIFAEFLQNNNIAVGDTDVNKNVFDGDAVTDDNNQTALVFVINATNQSITHNINEITQYGTYFESFSSIYALTGGTVGSYYNCTYTINGSTYIGDADGTSKSSNGLGFRVVNQKFNNIQQNILTKYDNYWTCLATQGQSPYGGTCIFKLSNNYYYIGMIAIGCGGNVYDASKFKFSGYRLNTASEQNVIPNVTINIKSTEINNKTYEGDTIINNEGDHIVNKEYKYEYPITDPTPVPTPNNITWPTIDLPDLDLDFRIDGLSDKFPFSIPKDLVSFYTLLNTEAQAPAIDRIIPLGFYDWHFEADFSQFEDYAEIVRKVEFIGFVVGLIYITIRLVKG